VLRYSTGIVPQELRHSRALKTSKCILAVLCVLLAVFGATVQLTHGHLDKQETPHSDCALCATAHATAVAAAPPIVLVAVRFLALVEVPAVADRPNPVLAFALSTRPPPAAFLPA
jgi:hypothetical protein